MIAPRDRARPPRPRAPSPSAHAAPPGPPAPSPRALALALVAAPAGAAVRVRVEAEGACPAPADLERAVGAWAAPEADASAPRFQLRTRPARGGARLELVDAAGKIVLTRTVASADCEALARAFALIAHAHFLELGLVRPLPPQPPALAPASTGGARPPTPGGPSAPPAGPASTGAAPPATSAPPSVAASSASAAPTAPPVSSALPPPPTKPDAPQGPASRPQRPGSLALGLGPGLVLPLPVLSPPALGFVDVTGRPGSWPVDVRLGAWLSTYAPAGQQASIRHRFSAVSLSAGRRFGGALALRPEAGLGLLWTTVDAKATEEPSISRLRLALKTGLSFTYALSPSLSARADLALHILPLTDRYVVVPLGEVGQAPRALALLGLGIEGQTPFW